MGLVNPFASSMAKALRHIARSSKIPKKNGQMFASPEGNVRQSESRKASPVQNCARISVAMS
jgi:hypothetical protein